MSRDPLEQEPLVVNDKRRIDPKTGELREPGGFSPFRSAKSEAPGDPDNAEQPIEAVVSDSVELENAKQEAAERLADLQRVTAEYANYRKRVDRDREQVVANAKSVVLTELLTVLDDIDRADAHGDLGGAFKAVADRLVQTLNKQGLVQFGVNGDEFDPALHEAVQFSTSPTVKAQTVTTVMRRGYSLGDRLVRPAVVGVTGPGDDPEPAAGDPLDPGSSGGPGASSPDGSTVPGDDNSADHDVVEADAGAERTSPESGQELPAPPV